MSANCVVVRVRRNHIHSVTCTAQGTPYSLRSVGSFPCLTKHIVLSLHIVSLTAPCTHRSSEIFTLRDNAANDNGADDD